MVQDKGGTYDRAIGWIIEQINKTSNKLDFPDFQRGCPQLVKGLRSQPFWDTSEFAWISRVEENFETIREELRSLEGTSSFQVL